MGQSNSDDDTKPSIPAIFTDQSLSEVEPLPATTEADFLQKLMSEDETNEDTLELDSKYEEIEYAISPVLPEIQQDNETIETTTIDHTYPISHALPDIQQDNETIETTAIDQTYPIPQALPDIQQDNETIETTAIDHTYPISHALPDIQQEHETIETTAIDQTKDLLQPTGPEIIQEQADPLTQPVSSPEQPSNPEQDPACQTRKRKNIYSHKQTKKHTKKKLKRYKRK